MRLFRVRATASMFFFRLNPIVQGDEAICLRASRSFSKPRSLMLFFEVMSGGASQLRRKEGKYV